MSAIRNKDIANLNVLLTDQVEKSVILTVHQQVKVRIFDRGQAANGSQIGRYSDPYVKQRIKKGLGSGKKVVLEFTGQMRNDFQVVEQGGQIGSGFLNKVNTDKSFWVEKTYTKQIFDLTDSEEQLVEDLYQQEVDAILNA